MSIIINNEKYVYSSHIENTIEDGSKVFIVEFNVTGVKNRKYILQLLGVEEFSEEIAYQKLQEEVLVIKLPTEEEIRIKNIEERYWLLNEKMKRLLPEQIFECKDTFDLLWSGTTLEEAQGILNKFGNNAINLFIIHSLWQDFIYKADNSYIKLTPPYNYIVNNDGTVTLD